MGAIYKNSVLYSGGGSSGSNVQTDWNQTDSTADDYLKNKPTALSAFTNDSGFITKTVNDLTNYYTTSNTLDPVYGGIKTIAPLNNIPALFSNSSSATNRSLVNEIDHKVNIEGYYADIGKTPAGMRMNPEEPIDENVTETAVEAPPSGTILYRL